MTLSLFRSRRIFPPVGPPPAREVLCPSGVVVNYNTYLRASFFGRELKKILSVVIIQQVTFDARSGVRV
jgi:hypothetical protein